MTSTQNDKKQPQFQFAKERYIVLMSLFNSDADQDFWKTGKISDSPDLTAAVKKKKICITFGPEMFNV